ncbi:hypothetical protein EDM60_05180 [Brevibacillus parabrevis]|nr:hypothetical protein EDM60_05180 [Brevibacillus parabrevis]
MYGNQFFQIFHSYTCRLAAKSALPSVGSHFYRYRSAFLPLQPAFLFKQPLDIQPELAAVFLHA